MSVWAHVGAAELFRVWVHWLWFKKTNRMKGTGGWVEGEERVLPLSPQARRSSLAAATTGLEIQGSPGWVATAPDSCPEGQHSASCRVNSGNHLVSATSLYTAWLRSGCSRGRSPTAPLEEI